jgi:hypothetical protein
MNLEEPISWHFCDWVTFDNFGYSALQVLQTPVKEVIYSRKHRSLWKPKCVQHCFISTFLSRTLCGCCAAGVPIGVPRIVTVESTYYVNLPFLLIPLI